MEIAIRRRQFIAGLSGVWATWPLAARAQQAVLPVIGYLHSGSAGPYAHLVAAFHQGLKETGTVTAVHKTSTRSEVLRT